MAFYSLYKAKIFINSKQLKEKNYHLKGELHINEDLLKDFDINLVDIEIQFKRTKYKQCRRCGRKVSPKFFNKYCDNGSCWASDNL